MLKQPLLMAVLAAVNAAVGSAQPLGDNPTLHTPDVIAPAVLPYLSCLYAERGLPLLRASDGSQIAFDRSDRNCAAARAQATVDAERLLQGKPVPGGQTAGAFVEQTLDDMDSYVASLPITKSSNDSGQQAVIGIPVTIEDEVQPAYHRYDECLKTQVSEIHVTADTIMATFRQAMTICSSIRELAVKEAEQALVAKGWDEAKRISAAESTFAKADESWLALGRQYQAMLLKSASRTSTPGKRE